jgi:mono/diheme cytochrome c family protein
MMMKEIKTATTLAFSAIFAMACGQASNTAVNKVTPSTPAPTPVISRAPDGKELFALNCMICHKETGKGGKVTIEGKSLNVEDLTKEKFIKATDEKLTGYITNGIEDEGMPSFKDKMTPEEIRAVVAHVRTDDSKHRIVSCLAACVINAFCLTHCELNICH